MCMYVVEMPSGSLTAPGIVDEVKVNYLLSVNRKSTSVVSENVFHSQAISP
jgi:hypothetical protein